MTTVNKAELSEILGISERTLTEWQKEDMPILSTGERGQSNAYDTQRVIAWWMARERAQACADTPRDRLYKVQEELGRLELAQKRRELVPVAEVEPAYAKLVVACRQRLLQLPMSTDLQLNETQRVQLEALVNDALRELSEYDPEDVALGT